MSNSRENTEVDASTEDRVNAMRGYKATLKNPRVSNEAKQHASEVLNNELGWDNPRQELYNVRDRNKDPNRVAGGLKAAQSNARNTERGKQGSAKKLDKLSQQAPEE
ncbi:hypothetical protein N7474_003570 [Penicillium riverlandense]|uniref:uncharacterized protein n=1 Tax=Penicillium riverlandense TaxID=1903569 RepID=UPI00254967E0|nr:uncharacterized protein N7474_003570 [Penicillium riverlandense]KAJ5826432.1 hypothetical protein N7474_003570 [Penicillium riverlandense]